MPSSAVRMVGGMLMVAVIMAATFITSGCLKQFSANHDDVKLKDLERLAAEVPPPPNFKEVGMRNYSTAERAAIYNAYNSTGSYGDIKRYYSALLTRDGWVYDGQDNLSYGGPDEGGAELRFRKGEFLIAIQYEGAHHLEDGRNCTVSFLWRQP